MDHERYKREFEEVREDCPWRYKKKCKPLYAGLCGTYRDCIQKNCPIFHFKKKFGRK